MKLQVVTRRSNRSQQDVRLWDGKCSVSRHLTEKYLQGKHIEFAVDTEDPNKRFLYMIIRTQRTTDSYKASVNMNFKAGDLCKHFDSVGKDVKFLFERTGKDEARDIIVLKRVM